MQCPDKIKKLLAKYKHVKDHNGLTGRGTRKWRYYDQLDVILGNRPASKPPIVLDTSDEARIVIECGTEDCKEPTGNSTATMPSNTGDHATALSFMVTGP